MSKDVLGLLRDEHGAAMTEYALVLALIAMAALGALTMLGSTIQQTLQNLATSLQGMQSG